MKEEWKKEILSSQDLPVGGKGKGVFLLLTDTEFKPASRALSSLQEIPKTSFLAGLSPHAIRPIRRPSSFGHLDSQGTMQKSLKSCKKALQIQI